MVTALVKSGVSNWVFSGRCQISCQSLRAGFQLCSQANRRAHHLHTSAFHPNTISSRVSVGGNKRRLLTQAAAAAAEQQTPATVPTGRLILLDAYALLYRSHFGFKDVRLNARTGEDTGILFAFIRTVFDLLELEPPPTHFAVVFDAAGHTFRHEMYPGYKGQRPPTPPAITEAAKQVRDLIRVMGISEVIVPGVEADDVIGTLAIRGIKEGFHVAIASPDKDFCQLLQPGLQLLRPPKKDYKGPLLANMVPYTSQSFVDEWDLQPSQFVDLLALAGDAADNVPGVKGVGFKTAPLLIRKHGGVEGVLASAHEGEKAGIRAKLTAPEAAPAARLSKKLVTIHTDVDLPPIRFPMDTLALESPSDMTQQATKAAFAHLDFKQHEKRLESIWNNMRQDPQGALRGDAPVWHSAVKTASELVQS